jgi:hypothetical protein
LQFFSTTSSQPTKLPLIIQNAYAQLPSVGAGKLFKRSPLNGKSKEAKTQFLIRAFCEPPKLLPDPLRRFRAIFLSLQNMVESTQLL